MGKLLGDHGKFIGFGHRWASQGRRMFAVLPSRCTSQ
jgi:hypothetical protein